MVHALEEIHRLLRPSGNLIHIHPFSEPELIKVIRDGAILFAEPKRESDHEGVQYAERAIAEVLGRKLFVADRDHEFDFFSFGSSVPELRDFWDQYNEFKESPDEHAIAAYEDEVFGRAEKILKSSSKGAQVAIHERVGITRLKPARR